MVERWSNRRKKLTARMAVTAALVGTGVGVLGVVPALADDDDTGRASNFRSEDRGRGGDDDDEHFRGKSDDVKYLWFRVCSLTGETLTATTTTTAPAAPAGTTGDGTDVAADALAAALAGVTEAGTTDTTTSSGTTVSETTDTVESTTADTTTVESTAVENGEEAEYPAFITLPMNREDAREIRSELRELSREERRAVCYDLTGRAVVGLTATADETTTTTTTTVAPTTETVAPTSETTTTTSAPAVAGINVGG